MSKVTLPFTGPAVIPPAIAFAIEFNSVHDWRRHRVAKDFRGYDCNDYAFDAVQALVKEGREPYYVVCADELGEEHIFAAYATQDGTIYARDNRVPDADLPLEELAHRGYVLQKAADRKGLIWYAYAA
jgi:hypothetical protein